MREQRRAPGSVLGDAATRHRLHLLDCTVSGPSQTPKSPGLQAGPGASAKAITLERRLRAERGRTWPVGNAGVWGHGRDSPPHPGESDIKARETGHQPEALSAAVGRGETGHSCGPRSCKNTPQGGVGLDHGDAVALCEHTRNKSEYKCATLPGHIF